MQKDWISAAGFRHRVHFESGVDDTDRHVLALHGFGVTGRSFRYVSGRLAQRGIGLFAPDLLGFGASARSPDGYSLSHYAELTTALAVRLGLRRPVLMGHSFGGKIAVASAVLHPDRFAGLVLVDTGGFGRLEQLLLLGDTPLVRVLDRPWVVEHLLPLVPLGRTLATPESREALLHMEGSYRNLDLRRTGLWNRLGEIDLPTLILWGDRDRVLPRSAPHRVRARIPHARLVVLPDAGHVPMKDQPDRFVEALAAFMRTDLESPPPGPRTTGQSGSDG